MVILGSEAGVPRCRPRPVVQEGPPAAGPHVPRGHRAGRIIDDGGDQATVATPAPVPRVASTRYLVTSTTCRPRPEVPSPIRTPLLQRQVAFGYHVRGRGARILTADGEGRREARGLRLATIRRSRCCRTRPRPLLRLLQAGCFAQVTNPPIDCNPRGADHLRRDAPRLRGQPAEPRSPRTGRRLELNVADHHQRGVRQRSAAWDLPGLRVGVLPDPVPRVAR